MSTTTDRPLLAYLSDEQRSRADALMAARRVLDRSGNGEVDAIDVVALAQFVLTGEDPFEVEDDVRLVDEPLGEPVQLRRVVKRDEEQS